jgi:hypothetical protein
VLVNGKVVVRDGRLVNVDEKALAEKANAIAKRLASES